MPDVPEGYYYSSLEAEEIEDRLLHVVTYHKTMYLSDEEKALFRTNIGAGTANTGLIILGYFDTLEDLRESLTVLPKAGDAYGIGTSAPYDIYIYDGYHGVWINNGPLNPGSTTFDDDSISVSKGWTSSKIKSELTTLDGNKQARITVSGILKGDGSGGVSAVTKGTDYGAKSFTVTLSASGWSNNAQTVSNSDFVTSGYAYVVSPVSGSFSDYGAAQIYADNVTTSGKMTFHCTDVPSTALTVNIVRVVSV